MTSWVVENARKSPSPGNRKKLDVSGGARENSPKPNKQNGSDKKNMNSKIQHKSSKSQSSPSSAAAEATNIEANFTVPENNQDIVAEEQQQEQQVSPKTPPSKVLSTVTSKKKPQESLNSNAMHLLKLARTCHMPLGDNPLKAIDYASRAAQLFEKEGGESSSHLELVLCLHIVAAGYCRLGRYDEAIGVLEKSLLIPQASNGPDHALALFAGHMQLGDSLCLVGRYESALVSYHNALRLQKQVLGDVDPRVADTSRYLSEAHLQVMQLEEAQELCEHVLDIHSKQSSSGSINEALDRKLMALIHTGKGEHEIALEHLILASTTLSCNEQQHDFEMASVDCSIGDSYLSLGRFDEAVFSYQKALTILKSSKGDAHASVTSVYASLADLYLRTGKQREAKIYCENALRILGKHNSGHSQDELANGLVEVAAVYEAMNEREQALSLLGRALDILEAAPGEQSTAAGVQAQMGIVLYVMGRFSDAYSAFKSAVDKMRVGSERQTMFLGMLLNQMGLASVELCKINNAVEHFDEAKRVLETVLGPHHSETLAVSSNLAGAYDALGRVDKAIVLLEGIVEVKEENLGTAHPEVVHDRERLFLLLKEVGRSRTRKTSTLEQLLSLPNVERIPVK